MSNEKFQKTSYNQTRRLKQAKLQRKIRQSQKKLAQLRALYQVFLILGMLILGYGILKLPQWRLPSNAFDTIDSPNSF